MHNFAVIVRGEHVPGVRLEHVAKEYGTRRRQVARAVETRCNVLNYGVNGCPHAGVPRPSGKETVYVSLVQRTRTWRQLLSCLRLDERQFP